VSVDASLLPLLPTKQRDERNERKKSEESLKPKEKSSDRALLLMSTPHY